jgi:hypothetical protein
MTVPACNITMLCTRCLYACILLQPGLRFLQAVPSRALHSAAAAAAVCRPPGSFTHVHLLPGRPLQAALPGLSGRLLEQLLREPPYELGWLGGLSSTAKVCGKKGSCCTHIEEASDP